MPRPALAHSRFRPAHALLVLCGLALVIAAGAVSPSREYDLKAVFLYNFASFIEWPPEKFPTPDSPLVIGVLGEDPFGRALDDVVGGERVRGHPLQVRRLERADDARDCHLVFICDSEARRIPSILKKLQGLPVVTVADSPKFIEAGGMIAFSTTDRVQLAINPGAARAAGLAVSSKLLRLARVTEVTTSPP